MRKVEASDAAQRVRHALLQPQISAKQTVAAATLMRVAEIYAMHEDLSGPSNQRTSKAVVERPAEPMSAMPLL